MKKAYVVVGWNGGDYSSSEEWVAAVALTLEAAEQRIVELQAWRDALSPDLDWPPSADAQGRFPASPGDSGWDWEDRQYDYDKVKWSVREVELIGCDR